MSYWWQPAGLFNPLLMPADAPLTLPELLSGPTGLAAFAILVPLLRPLARRRGRRVALVGCGLAWLIGTLGPLGAGILLGAVAVGASWVVGLGALRRRGWIGQSGMTALVWIGLHALALPLWWFPSANWYGWEPSRLPVLHNIGLAYFLLRLVAWGVRLAREPLEPLRPVDTVCWLLYPPCMRLGPVLLRHEFLERLDRWDPGARPAWRAIGRRVGLCALGMCLLGMITPQMPHLRAGAVDFFESPQSFATPNLVNWFYLIPIYVYLLLWTYNELAMALSLWVGIPVDNNFHWLPCATSVRDFWRRWHVTVGDWLREHVYIPLGGNRRHVWLNYVAVFGYMGMWHGPSWSFLAWGLLQAVALIVQREWDRLRDRLGWNGRPSGRVWSFVGWLLTVHYAAATIVIFTDYGYLGTRFLPELFRRLCGVGGS